MKTSHPQKTEISRRAISFLRCEGGWALPYILLGLVMLICAAGTAIDMGRVQMAQTRMQKALDATGLALRAENLEKEEMQEKTTQHFYTHFPPNYMRTTVATLAAAPQHEGRVIVLTAAGTTEMTFLKVFGIYTAHVSARSQATRQ